MNGEHLIALPKSINPETVTIQDCIDNYRFKNEAVVLRDGCVITFQQETPAGYTIRSRG